MRVGLFVTCLVDLMRPRIGMAALKLLESAGCEVVVPARQTCCGQPAYNGGDFESTRRLARKFVAEFDGCDYVVLPSGSCAAMIRLHYPRLFTFDDPEFQAVQQLARNTYELTQFLTQITPPKELPGTFTGRITYHDSCSGFRELQVYDEPRVLLARLPGVTLNEMHRSTDCCGFGGAFAVKFGDISGAICEHKCAQITATGAATVVGGDLGCLLNIEGRLRRRGDSATQVLHIAELLAGEGDGCA